jgi:hypothetical protein
LYRLQHNHIYTTEFIFSKGATRFDPDQVILELTVILKTHIKEGNIQIFVCLLGIKASGVAQWLRPCGTSRKVPGSIPGVAGLFSVASDSSMCLGVDSASKNEYLVNPGGKGCRCVRLTTYHLHVPMSRNLGTLTSWNPVGLFRPVMGQLYLYLK